MDPEVSSASFVHVGFEVSRAGFFRANWLIPILASDEYYRQSLHSAADDSTTALEDDHEKN
jgi:hypothetical protein